MLHSRKYPCYKSSSTNVNSLQVSAALSKQYPFMYKVCEQSPSKMKFHTRIRQSNFKVLFSDVEVVF